jgi:peptidoglycan/LPS O-acetylase OafA/YrhL
MLVFGYHVARSRLPEPEGLIGDIVTPVLMAGTWGVELFFAISGYVIAGSLSRARSLAAFARDRFARLGPVLWVTVLLVLFLSLLTDTRQTADMSFAELVRQLGANLLALPGVLPLVVIHPPAWSLSYEVLFYTVIGLAAAARGHARGVKVALAAVAVILLIVYPRALPFLAGLAVARGLPSLSGATNVLIRHPTVLLVAFLVSWSLVSALSEDWLLTNSSVLPWLLDLRLPLAILAMLAVTGALAGIVAGHGLLLVPFLRSPTMVFLGTISYSLYMWHPIVMAVTKRAIVELGISDAAGPYAWAVFALVSLPPSILVSWASYRILEQWASRRLREALKTPSRGDPPLRDPAPEPRSERSAVAAARTGAPYPH